MFAQARPILLLSRNPDNSQYLRDTETFHILDFILVGPKMEAVLVLTV